MSVKCITYKEVEKKENQKIGAERKKNPTKLKFYTQMRYLSKNGAEIKIQKLRLFRLVELH